MKGHVIGFECNDHGHSKDYKAAVRLPRRAGKGFKGQVARLRPCERLQRGFRGGDGKRMGGPTAKEDLEKDRHRRIGERGAREGPPQEDYATVRNAGGLHVYT